MKVEQLKEAARKISKAKNIIGEIWKLSGDGNDSELNKATDAMYRYIDEIELTIKETVQK